MQPRSQLETRLILHDFTQKIVKKANAEKRALEQNNPFQ